jgi:Zn-dependent peptidase ImmA (M78 family)
VIEKHGIDWEIGILPGKSPLDAVGQAREAGERLGFHPALRRTWATPDEAFLWWRRRIEDQGVFCFQMKLEPGDVRGCALWLDSHYPFILVNHHGAEAATGRTFTLLHEYAHLLTATGGLVCDFRGASEADNPEGFANQFAARMLITHDELRHQLDDLGQRSYRDAWPDDVLDQIRAPFFVSRDVVAITLEQLNLAPKGLYQVKRAQWEARRPWGRGGPNRKAMTKKERKLRELGFSLSRVLSRPDMASAIPLTDLCSVLDMKVEKVHDFLSWVRTAMDNE